MSKPLFTTLDSISQIDEKAKSAIFNKMKSIDIAKNSYLLEPGKVCNNLYFIEQGALRGFYDKDGKEITHWLAFEKGLATCFYSFISRKPGVEYIQALENTKALAISYEDLNQWYVDYPQTERLGRLLLEKYYTQLEDRLLSIQFEPAKERYNTLMSKFPHILQRVPLGCIASYLGITQETLSRIRSN